MSRTANRRRFAWVLFGAVFFWIPSCRTCHDEALRESGSASAPCGCSLSNQDWIARRRTLERDLIPFIERTEQLDDGLRLWFGGDANSARRVFDFVRFERRCCNFLRYEIVLEPSDGPIALTLRGDAEATRTMKELLDEALAARSRKGE